MDRIRLIFDKPLISNRALLGLFQTATVFTALGVLFLGLRGVTLFATSPFEVFVGVVSIGTLALALVILAILAPFAVQRINT